MYPYCQFCKYKTSFGDCYCYAGYKFEPAVASGYFLNKMTEIKSTYDDDPEEVHRQMDGYMCDVLDRLGYKQGIKVFKDAEKWYT